MCLKVTPYTEFLSYWIPLQGANEEIFDRTVPPIGRKLRMKNSERSAIFAYPDGTMMVFPQPLIKRTCLARGLRFKND